jgi:hypothetical protein
MKRFISTLCLLVGASVASYAGVISTAAGTSLLGANGSYLNFDNATTFPLFTSFNSILNVGTLNAITNAATGPSVSITSTTSTSPITNDIGSFSVGAGGTFGTVGGSGSRYLQTVDSTGSTSMFAGRLTFTFSSSQREFLIDYASVSAASIRMLVDGIDQGTLSTNTGAGSSQIGFAADGTGAGALTSFSTIAFEFTGTGAGSDLVYYDNLRVSNVLGTNGTTGSTGGNGTGGPGPDPEAVPEPSTYALMGAGLLALGYARRNKK